MKSTPIALTAAALLVCLLPRVDFASRQEQGKPKWRGTIPVDFTRIARRARISEADAEKAALAALGNDAASATVAHKELETEDDALVYEVVVSINGKKREIQVDAGTGKVLGRGERGSIRLDLGRMAKVGKMDAQRAAVAAVEGDAADKSVGDSELEVEHGYLVYEIDVKVKGKPGAFEVLVDAGNGKVLATEREGAGED